MNFENVRFYFAIPWENIQKQRIISSKDSESTFPAHLCKYNWFKIRFFPFIIPSTNVSNKVPILLYCIKIAEFSFLLKDVRNILNLTFFLIYAFDDLISFSTSPAKSLLISVEQILPNVHRAKLTMYWVWWFKSLKMYIQKMLSFVLDFFLQFHSISLRSKYNNWI